MKKKINSSLIQKIIFLLSVFLIFFIAIISYKNIRKLSDSTQKVNNTYNVSLSLENLYMNLNELEDAKKNYIMEQNESIKNIIFKKKYIADFSLNRLKQQSKNNNQQSKNIHELETLVKKNYKIVDEALLLPSEKYKIFDTVKLYLLKGAPVMSQIKNKITEMKKIEKENLKQRSEIYNTLSNSLPLLNSTTLLIAIIMFTASSLTLLKKLGEAKETNTKLTLANESAKMAERIGNYGTWQYNVNKNEFYFSDNEYRLFGYEPEELNNKLEDYIDEIYPGEIKRQETLIGNLKVEEMLGPNLYKIIRRDGEHRKLRDISKLVENVYGEKILIGVTTDVTNEYFNQKKNEQKNKELEQKNKILFLANETKTEAEVVGKFGTTQWFVNENRFEFSENIYRLFGLDPAEEAGLQKMFECIHPDDVSLAEAKLQELNSKYAFEPYVLKIIRADNNELRYLSVNNKHIRDFENEEYVLIISVDVTEIVNAQKTIIERNKELEESNHELQAFNYFASHDLQEPLRKIETFISRLETTDHQNLTDMGNQYFNRIKISTERMRQLIEDLLQFSRAGKSEKIFEDVNLNMLLEKAISEMTEFIEEKQATIESEELPTLRVISFQIQQLFINLLCNSIKYSKPDVSPFIKINYEQVKLKKIADVQFPSKKLFHKFTFKDNGIGFDPAYSDRIFELFSRLHNKDEIIGTGLGLAICKKIVDNHKGFIFGEGKLGEGSVFTIYLPTEMS